jgi:hypothetical protein
MHTATRDRAYLAVAESEADALFESLQ